MSPLPKQPNRSVLEGIDVLLAVARAGEPVRVRALARELGQTPTRLQRYLATLAHSGILIQTGDRRYAPGPGMHALSAISLSASGLASRALEVLPPLAESGCIVALGVLWRHSITYIYFQLPGTSPTKSLGRVSSYPAHDSSIGHVLLAQLPSERVAADYPNHPQLADALAQVRAQQFAQIDRSNGEISLAVPVGNPAIAGLALSGKLSLAALPTWRARLQSAAAALTA